MRRLITIKKQRKVSIRTMMKILNKIATKRQGQTKRTKKKRKKRLRSLKKKRKRKTMMMNTADIMMRRTLMTITMKKEITKMLSMMLS